MKLLVWAFFTLDMKCYPYSTAFEHAEFCGKLLEADTANIAVRLASRSRRGYRVRKFGELKVRTRVCTGTRAIETAAAASEQYYEALRTQYD